MRGGRNNGRETLNRLSPCTLHAALGTRRESAVAVFILRMWVAWLPVWRRWAASYGAVGVC